MAHRFQRAKSDVFADSAHQVEGFVFIGSAGYRGGANEELYDALSNAIVSALGDIAFQAFRRGVNDPKQIRGLAKAVARMSEEVLTSYLGEVDPEGALQAIENDPRLAALPETARETFRREIEKTRQLEHLLLDARRIPDLLDFAGDLGLHIPDEVMEQGTVLLGEHPTPTANTTSPGVSDHPG
jgi:hypothetical protein